MSLYEDVMFNPATIQLSKLDKAVYGQLHDFAQDPYLGTIMGEVPVLGTYMRAHEQANELFSFMNETNVSPSEVLSPVTTYGSWMPAVASGIDSIFGYIGNSRKTKSRKRRTATRVKKMRRYYGYKPY